MAHRTHRAPRTRRSRRASRRAYADGSQSRSRHGRRSERRARASFGRAAFFGVVVALAGAGGFLALRGTELPDRLDRPPASGTSAAPAAGSSSPAPRSYASVSSGSSFRPILDRGADPRPLTAREVFAGSSRSPSYGEIALSLRETRLDSDCAAAVWGKQLKRDIEMGGCSQVVRGSYGDAAGRVTGMVAIFNMKDVEAATTVVGTLDPAHGAGFVLPLPADGRLGRPGGRSEAFAHAMGHYVFVRWAQVVADPTPGGRLDRAVSDANVALTEAQTAIRRRAAG